MSLLELAIASAILGAIMGMYHVIGLIVVVLATIAIIVYGIYTGLTVFAIAGALALSATCF